RDAKGAPIVDLKPSDFELLEDDVKQRIASVELIAPGRTTRPALSAAKGGKAPEPVVAPTPDPATPTEGAARPTVLALVFHRLSAEGRALAQRAARSYLDTAAQPGDYAGVFVIDTRLDTLQTFTTDAGKLSAAIERAARTQAADTARHQPMSTLFGDSSPDVSPTASAESVGRPLREPGFVPRMQAPSASSANPREDTQGMAQRLGEHMERAYEEMMRDRNGNVESAALTALVTAMGALPGRKSVVLFSEGVAVPDTLQTKFRAVVDTANRGNVTIYAIDAKGLRLHSEQAATARGLAELRGVGDDDQRPDMVAERDRRSSRTADLERGAFLLNKDPAANLGTLAKDTGGFLINNTNDLASAFQRIDADRRFHYLLTYTPLDTSMNGAFRRISVKVKRRGADVRARSGYVALPMLGTVPVLRFESNALSALAATPRPTQIPLRASAYQFPEADGTTRVALYVKAPGSGVAYFVDDNQTAWQTHFTILARIVDDKGETVRKGSQPYRLTGPAKDVHVARQGDLLFYRQPTVDPGRYTIDYALYDELSGQAGTGALSLEVPAREASALAVSDLILVDHAEAVPADQKDPRNPLYLGTTLIYPNLGTPIVRSKRGSLVFFYTARAAKRPLTGRVELVQGGQVLATRALAVPHADDTGLVQHANELPLDDVGAGGYELRVSLSNGKDTVTRSTPLSIVP
ncbi:MAG: VWA domain-containing protein, partial [Vicinamibacteraceae bacterium]